MAPTSRLEISHRRVQERGQDDAGVVAMRSALGLSPADLLLLREHGESLLCSALEQEEGSLVRKNLADEARTCLESAVRCKMHSCLSFGAQGFVAAMSALMAFWRCGM